MNYALHLIINNESFKLTQIKTVLTIGIVIVVVALVIFDDDFIKILTQKLDYQDKKH